MDTVAKVCLTIIAVVAIIAMVVMSNDAGISARLIDVVLVCASAVGGMAMQNVMSRKHSAPEPIEIETRDVL